MIEDVDLDGYRKTRVADLGGPIRNFVSVQLLAAHTSETAENPILTFGISPDSRHTPRDGRRDDRALAVGRQFIGLSSLRCPR